ncbi:hypothetical protein [Nocardioides sp. REDSEA-S30_B4]|uniref:hypothetical protein n=1 Tax=Nocardioides sp. REDSEA-S30_B4 TaxID=1811552 RepID=UPI0025DD727F|nr:hypothetical protein [Nocardioides sp. REDSEA-S30_B4]
MSRDWQTWFLLGASVKIFRPTLLAAIGAVIAMPLGFAAAQDGSNESSRSVEEQGGGVLERDPANAAPSNDVFPIRPGETLEEYQGRINEAGVLLKDCPELKSFFTDPEKVKFIEEYFGPEFAEKGKFIGGCPDAQLFEASFERAVSGGEGEIK